MSWFVNRKSDMKAHPTPTRRQRGFTLLEMSIVIMILMALISMGIYTSRATDDWKLARAASENLRSVYTAQRMYLADHPTDLVASLTAVKLLPYMPNNAPIPTVKSKTGAALAIILNQFPPVIDAGGGVVYDPSGSNKDDLWDVGK